MIKAESQEPVAWIVPVQTHGGDLSQKLSWTKSGVGISGVLGMLSERFPLYKSPQEWVGLTKEEFFEIYISPATIVEQMSMIEAKLKEKNT